MPFRPYNFYRLGLALAASNAESRRRTGIGRLYYAVHLKARESLVRAGWRLPQQKQHKAVIRQLRKAKNPNVEMVRTLKRLRERSDYDLVAPVTLADSTVASSIAQFVWDTI